MKGIGYKVVLAGIVLFLVACQSTTETELKEKWKEEVLLVEADFAAMAEEECIGKAFIYYAADSAVLMRSNKLIKGKDAISEVYGNLNSDKIKLTWKPDFVEVSASGDLAYTYGKYLFEETDSMGEGRTEEGIFHTVWQRQEDGKWKFVWD